MFFSVGHFFAQKSALQGINNRIDNPLTIIVILDIINNI